jgi:hypothetical protein
MWLLSVNDNTGLLTRRRSRINNYISRSNTNLANIYLSICREDWVTEGDEIGFLRMETKADMILHLSECYAAGTAGEI